MTQVTNQIIATLREAGLKVALKNELTKLNQKQYLAKLLLNGCEIAIRDNDGNNFKGKTFKGYLNAIGTGDGRKKLNLK